MMDLKRLFKNYFDTKEISDDNLRKFAEIHLERLSANNARAQFTAMITATTTAYQHYFGAMTNEDTKFAIQQGLTVTLNNIVDDFKKAVSQKEGIIRGNFGKESAEYQEFFPLGLTEYSTANLANIELLMKRMAASATVHAATLGRDLGLDFEAKLAAFQSARQAQLLKIGEVVESKTGTSAQRDAIENELMKNVHLIASMFIGDVERCMDFFDQSFIRSNDKEEEGETPPSPPTPIP
jgi:hypothetical protein